MDGCHRNCRYQCLQCLSYDLCQTCFFTGSSTRGHKPNHPVQEYCYKSTRREEARAFLTKIVNKFKSRSSSNSNKKMPMASRKIVADREADYSCLLYTSDAADE